MKYEQEHEELNRLQEIIARHEDQSFKVRGWMYAVLTVLTAALFAKESTIGWQMYIQTSALVTALFLTNELVHRAIVRYAIVRTEKIESLIRQKQEYDGPLVSESLSKRLNLCSMLREFRNPTIWVHYITLWIILICIAAGKACN